METLSVLQSLIMARFGWQQLCPDGLEEEQR